MTAPHHLGLMGRGKIKITWMEVSLLIKKIWMSNPDFLMRGILQISETLNHSISL